MATPDQLIQRTRSLWGHDDIQADLSRLRQVPASRPDQLESWWLDAQLEHARQTGEAGTLIDHLANLYDDLDEIGAGFDDHAQRIGFDPSLYAEQQERARNERTRKALLAEEYLAHAAEAEALSRLAASPAETGLIQKAVTRFVERIGEMMAHLRFTTLANWMRPKDKSAADESLSDYNEAGVLRRASALLSGLRERFGMPEPAALNAPPSSSKENLSLEDVIARVESLTITWPAAMRDRVAILTDPEDAPEAMKRRLGSRASMAGGYDDATGQILIVASRMDSNEEIERTLWHEWTHLAANTPVDPGHPVTLHDDFRREAARTLSNQEITDLLGPDGQNKYREIAHGEDALSLPRHISSSVGRLIGKKLVELDPEQVAPQQLSRLAFLAEGYADRLEAAGMSNLASEYQQKAADLFEQTHVSPEAALSAHTQTLAGGSVGAPLPWRERHDPPAMTAAASQVVSGIDPSALDQEALYRLVYHGSSNRFDRFDTAHVKEHRHDREQAWGLHFSAQEDVARWYQEHLGQKPSIEINGHHINSLGDLPGSAQNPMVTAYANSALLRSNGDLDQARSFLIERRDLLRDEASDTIELKSLTAKASLYGRAVVLIDGLAEHNVKVIRPESYLYQVDAPDDEHYLDANLPLSEQSLTCHSNLHVAQDLVGDRPWEEDWRGDRLYRHISRLTGGDREASAYLDKLGVPGMRSEDHYTIWSHDTVAIRDVIEQGRHEDQAALQPAPMDDMGIVVADQQDQLSNSPTLR